MGFAARQILARISGLAVTSHVVLGLSLNFCGPQFQTLKKQELCAGNIFILQSSHINFLKSQ